MKTIEEEYDLAIKLNKLGSEQYSQHQYKNAEKSCLQAVKIGRLLVEYDHDKYDRTLAIFLNNLGKIYMGLHRMKKSFQYFKEAWEIISAMPEEKKEKDGYGTVSLLYNDYAMLYSYFAVELEGWYGKAQKSEFEEGCRLFEKALRYADMIEYYEGELALVHHLYGRFFLKNQRLDEAEEQLNKALTIYRKRDLSAETDDHLYVAVTLEELGSIKNEKKEYAASIAMLQEALSIYMELDVYSPNKYDEQIRDLRKNLMDINIELKKQDKKA